MAYAYIKYCELDLQVEYLAYSADDGGYDYPSTPSYIELESVCVISKDGEEICLDYLLTEEQNAEIVRIVEKEVL